MKVSDLKQQREEHGVIVPAAKSGLLATTSRGGLDAYLAKHDVGDGGKFVKFGKEGSFIIPSEQDKIIPLDTEFVCPWEDTLGGMQKFNGRGNPPTKHVGPIVLGYVPPDRETLGDTDESLWEKGLDGKPQDPWQHTLALPLLSKETQEKYIFTTSSLTGRRAVLALLKAARREKMRSGDDFYPVIKLQTSGFAHRDSRVGWVKTPAFPIVGKAPKDDYAAATSSIDADMDDAIPF